MRSDAMFVGAIVAFVAFLAIDVWLLTAFLPGVSPLAVLIELSVLMKAAAVLIILLAIAGLIGGLMGEATLCRIVAVLAVLVALLGAAYGEMNVQAALRQIGPVDFAVTAPARVESITLLALGMFVAVLSFGLSRLRRLSKA